MHWAIVGVVAGKLVVVVAGDVAPDVTPDVAPDVALVVWSSCDVAPVVSSGCDVAPVDTDGAPVVVEDALKQPTIIKVTLLGALFSYETSRYTANIKLSYSLAGVVYKILISRPLIVTVDSPDGMLTTDACELTRVDVDTIGVPFTSSIG